MTDTDTTTSDYRRGYEQGRQSGLVSGRKQSADTLRAMLGIMAQDRDADVARCATLLLQGFNQEMAGKL